MGRGHGGYTDKQASYTDSGGQKVTDIGAIFVGERYIDAGYETVFRRQRQPEKSYDLTIKSSDDKEFIKNIEVKRIVSSDSSKIATRIKEANEQISEGDTIAIVLPGHINNSSGISFAKKGVDEAIRKGYKNGPIEVWFSDKTKIEF